MHESLLIYKKFKYLKLTLTTVILSIVLYLYHSPIGSPNGGTWLGYTLGTIAALIMFWLAWFGARKRSYKNFDEEIFLQEVRNLPLWQIYSCDDPEDPVSILCYFLSSILDRLAPLKTYQVRKNYCPWLTNETKLLINPIPRGL